MLSKRRRTSASASLDARNNSSAVNTGIAARSCTVRASDMRDRNSMATSAAALLVLCLSTPLLAQGTLIDQGRTALIRREPERAVDLLERAVAQDPNSAEAHYLLGDAYGDLAQKASIFKQPGLARRTREEFERAVELDPNHVQTRFGLVHYYIVAPGFMGGD